MNKQLNFTLVELLVTIAIIIILTGLLLPALNSAKERAQAITCLGNCKQMGFAVLSYCEDNNQEIPRYLISIPATPYQKWQSQLMRYLYPNKKFEIAGGNAFIENNKPLPPFRCPSAPAKNFQRNNYGINAWNSSKGHSFNVTNAKRIRHHSRRMIIMDIGSDATGENSLIYEKEATADKPNFVPYRHLMRPNIVYLDGHAEGRLRTKIPEIEEYCYSSKASYFWGKREAYE